MGCLCTLGESVYTEGRTPDCERFERAWAIPEDAIKPDRLTPGVKSKRSSTVMNTAKSLPEFFTNWLANANGEEILCLSGSSSEEICGRARDVHLEGTECFGIM